MEHILHKIKEKGITPGKLILIIIAVVVLLPIVVWLVSFSIRTAFDDRGVNTVGYAPGYGGGYATDVYMEESAAVSKLSARNLSIYPPTPQVSQGSDAEEFEVTEYSGTIRSRNAERTCAEIGAWKSEEDIIFENANTYEHGCNFVFKVPRENREDILSRLEDYSLENLSGNTRTIKSIVDDYTSEIEILEKKLESIEKTLTDAGIAYDEVTRLATQTQNVESLAKIIDSKVNLIERLTSQRIDIKNQIEYLLRAKDEQADRVKYTVFRLNVYEQVIVDGRDLKNSWVYALSRFVREGNEVLQGLTIGLLGFFLKVVQAMVYALIALFIAKYGWRFVRFVWKK